MPEQNKLSTEANNTGCQDYELLAEYHSDIGQDRPRPTGIKTDTPDTSLISKILSYMEEKEDLGEVGYLQ